MVHKKSGFLIKHLPVIINDENGKVFYNTSDLYKNIQAFNLPKGNYSIIKGTISPLVNPVSYTLKKLPMRERFLKPSCKNFKMTLGNNPHKVSILWDEKRILVDTDFFKTLNRAELAYILAHEQGHEKYGTEKLADLFAMNQLLFDGYNPSQIGKAILTTLSSNNIERKEFIINSILT